MSFYTLTVHNFAHLVCSTHWFYVHNLHIVKQINLQVLLQNSFVGVHSFVWRKFETYLIFVTGTTGGARGEKICHVEKFVHMTDFHVEKFSKLQTVMRKNSPHEKCEDNL